jgi:RNA polymerase sigma-70 factor (ECF subfamily)
MADPLRPVGRSEPTVTDFVIEWGRTRHQAECLTSLRPCMVGSPERKFPPREDPVAAMSRNAWDAAFHDIYQEHFDFVWATLRHLGVREADVLDLTQAVFVTVYAKLSTFEGRSTITTWLFGICRRLASAYRRSARFRREVPTDGLAIDRRAAPESLLARSNMREQAESILNKLPEAQRLVFVLFELEELSGPEIAGLLGISLGTVRSRLRLARTTFERLGHKETL